MKHYAYLTPSQPRLFRTASDRAILSAWLIKAAGLILIGAAVLAMTGCKDAGKVGGAGGGTGASEPPPLSAPPAAPPMPSSPAASAPADGASK
jgi:hypothetical protein